MRVLIAGATGAIGRPLVAALLKRDHEVIGISSSAEGVARLEGMGARGLQMDVLDAGAVDRCIADLGPETIIGELTSLPRDPRDIAAAAERDRRVRLEGGGNLLRSAAAHGIARYLQQASGFFLAPGPGLGDESEPLAVNASPAVAAFSQTYMELESRLRSAPLNGVALRYGFFYGPGTWYDAAGTAGDAVRRQQTPLIGAGQGVYSWVHIDDAADATVAALTAPAGVYHVVDDDPSTTAVWLPAFARLLGAPPPLQVDEETARVQYGEDAVYYQTRLRGASNAKAKRELGFRPRRLEWLASGQ